MKINGETKIIGFFGSTYKSSKMYKMYNTAFEELNLNFIYVPFVVDDLKKAVEGVRNLGIHALGVTIPYKIEIIKYLDKLDKNARRIGAVNVVINNNGKLTGGNTDGLGAVRALKEITDIRNKKVIMLGSGGAARAIAFAIKDEGGNLTIVNRSFKSGRDLSVAAHCRFIQLDQLGEEINEVDILINATTVGMSPDENNSLVPSGSLKSKPLVMDLVTNPKKTKLLKEAESAGCRTIYGQRMLFWQAVLKFKMYTGVDAPINIMWDALDY